MKDIYHKIDKGERETYKRVQKYYLDLGYRWCSTGTDIFYPYDMDTVDNYILADEDRKTLTNSGFISSSNLTPNFMCEVVPEELFAI